jgi:hypothetical protein
VTNLVRTGRSEAPERISEGWVRGGHGRDSRARPCVGETGSRDGGGWGGPVDGR